MATGEDYQYFLGTGAAGEEPTPSLEAAIVDAYERAQGSGHTRFRVAEIIITGTNPINDYKVVLQPLP